MYHSITLYNLTNLEYFFDLVDSCKGQIKMRDIGGKIVDIRENIWIKQQLIWSLPIGRIPRIELYFEKLEEGRMLEWLLG